MFDMVTQHRKDGKLTYEDLVIAKVTWKTLFLREGYYLLFVTCFIIQATYEKGTDDEIAEFIYQTLDVNGNGVLTRYMIHQWLLLDSP